MDFTNFRFPDLLKKRFYGNNPYSLQLIETFPEQPFLVFLDLIRPSYQSKEGYVFWNEILDLYKSNEDNLENVTNQQLISIFSKHGINAFEE